MFTNNYIKYREALFFAAISSYSFLTAKNTSYTGTTGFRDRDFGTNMGYPVIDDPTTSTATGVYFGSGTTPPTKDDYTLEVPITAGLIATGLQQRALLAYDGNGKATAEGSYILKNTSEETITVNEIGYFANGHSNGTSSYLILHERSVLDTPCVLEPGEAKMVTYRITFNHF